MLRTVSVETSNHAGNRHTILLGVLFEEECLKISFKFLYKFFYGILAVGLNPQQYRFAVHCSAVKI